MSTVTTALATIAQQRDLSATDSIFPVLALYITYQSIVRKIPIVCACVRVLWRESAAVGAREMGSQQSS